MPKRTRRKSSRPPPARRRGGRGGREPESLEYKVVELSTVDEGSLEQTVNRWVRQGWSLENVQFAMRESSKRPSMAFVFFTRPGNAAEIEHDATAARQRLLRLADPNHPEADRRTWAASPERAADPWARLEHLAGDPDGDTEDPG